jgi:hypothetical protein
MLYKNSEKLTCSVKAVREMKEVTEVVMGVVRRQADRKLGRREGFVVSSNILTM